MFKKQLLFHCVFFYFNIFTPIVKNNTRIIEKNIESLSKDISILEKQLNDAKIDFVYLSSPERLKKLIKF